MMDFKVLENAGFKNHGFHPGRNAFLFEKDLLGYSLYAFVSPINNGEPCDDGTVRFQLTLGRFVSKVDK